MKIRLLKAMAGVEAGFENELPDALAKILISRGDAEEVKAEKAPAKKEEAPEMETKEEKIVSKRRTKRKK